MFSTPRPAVDELRRPLVAATAAVSLWAVLVAWVAFQAIDGSWARSTLAETAASDPGLGLGSILATNLAAALLLFSGAATLGLTTLLASAWTAGYVGATMAVAVENAGAGRLLSRVWPYLPLELGAMLLAGIAGAYPVMAAALPGPGLAGLSVGHRYLRGSRTSLALLALSAAGLVVAALVERAVMV